MKKCCGNCYRYEKPKEPVDLIHPCGKCQDAEEIARKVVPFAVNLSSSGVYADGGKDCPCFVKIIK